MPAARPRRRRSGLCSAGRSTPIPGGCSRPCQSSAPACPTGGGGGCGKSTAGTAILKLIEPTAGEIRVNGERIDGLSRHEMRPYRRELQVVFQDPYSSLNPRLKIREIIGEPLKNYGIAQGRA